MRRLKPSENTCVSQGIRTKTGGNVQRTARLRRGRPRTSIFVADDQPLVREGLKLLINDEPDMKTCGEADNCADTWNDVQRLCPDVVLVELSLRDDSAIGLIRRIRDFNESIGVIVYSRHSDQGYAMPSFKAGARAFVMKRDDPGTLIQAIRRVRKGELSFSEAVGSQILDRITSPGAGKRRDSVAALSPRELEVVTLIAGGLTAREIAGELSVSIKTVEAHRAHIKQKANLDSGTALVRFSMRVTSEDPIFQV